MAGGYKYHHVGIPTDHEVEGMAHIEHLKIRATDHEIQSLRDPMDEV